MPKTMQAIAYAIEAERTEVDPDTGQITAHRVRVLVAYRDRAGNVVNIREEHDAWPALSAIRKTQRVRFRTDIKTYLDREILET